MDELLQDPGVAAAELGRVARQQPPVVELQSAASRRAHCRHMRVERDRSAACASPGRWSSRNSMNSARKRLDLGVEGELHRSTYQVLNICVAVRYD